jgi:DNA-binding MarR family transcriptional regulator
VTQPNPQQPHRTEPVVVPLHGERSLVPSPVRVRGRLEGEAREVVRAGVAVALALAEREEVAPAAAAWRGWEAPVALEAAVLAERTGLSPADVEGALTALLAAGVLQREPGAMERAAIDAAVLAPLPSLAETAWSAVRDRLRDRSGSWAVPLALYAELLLQGGAPAGAPGRWVQCSVATLAEATAYGRTAITQSLGVLDDAGLLERAPQPARRALRLRLLPLPASPGRGVVGAHTPASAAPVAAAEAGALTVVVNGVSLVLGAGSTLEVGDGANVRLEREGDGTMRVVVR